MSDLNQLHSDKNTHTIGDVIRTRREELQLSLEEVSQRLRIRLVFLKALEDGRIDLLPGVVYASGFLKAYAELLQLDSVALVKKFRQEHQVNIQKPTLMFPAPVPQSGVPAGVMIFFSVLIMVVAYVGWYKMTDHQQAPSNIIPPAPVQNNQNTNTLQPVSPQIASIMPAEHPSPLPQDNKPGDMNANKPIVVTNNIQPQPSMPPQPVQQAAMQTNTAPANPQSTALSTPSQPSTENTNPKPVEPKQPEQPLMLKAIAPSWLQIKDKEGHVLYQKVLKKDETWQVPNDKDEIVMTIGNPGVVVLQKGDVQSAPLGKKGRTLRRFSLNASKADMLLKGDLSDPSSTSPSDSPAQQVRKKNKPVVSRPVSAPRHDSSADDLNAGQLNH